MSKCPSLSQLKAEERERWLRSQEARIRAEARNLGVKNPDDKDLWKVLRLKNDAYDEIHKRPQVEARARALGIPTHTSIFGLLRRPRNLTDLSLECYAEEDRRALCRRLEYSS